MQLVAYGAQDIYLTGNPQITYEKWVEKHSVLNVQSTFKNKTVRGLQMTKFSSQQPQMLVFNSVFMFSLLLQGSHPCSQPIKNTSYTVVV